MANIKKKEMDPNRDLGVEELDLADSDIDTVEDIPDMPMSLVGLQQLQ